MGFTLQEDPGFMSQDVFCDGHEAGLSVRRRLEDLVRDISIGCKNDESAVGGVNNAASGLDSCDTTVHILVEDRDTAERTARPLCKIGFKFWIKCLDKWAGQWDFEFWPSYWTLSHEVLDYDKN